MSDAEDFADQHIARIADQWPTIDFEVEGAAVRISMLSRYLDKTLAETLRDFDLSEGEYKVLVKLKSSGTPYRMTPTQLQKVLLVSSGAMTNRLDGLEEQGLVTPSPDPSDRRGVLIELTDDGVKRVDEAVAIQSEKEKKIFESLSEEDKKSLNDSLRLAVLAIGEPLAHTLKQKD